MTNDVKYLSHAYELSFSEMSTYIFCQFLTWDDCLIMSYKNSLYILYISIFTFTLLYSLLVCEMGKVAPSGLGHLKPEVPVGLLGWL